MAKTDPINFEQSLETLTQLVEEMERGDLALEDALKKFEPGVTLTRQCQDALKKAEQHVQILMEKNGVQSFEPFTTDDADTTH